MEGDISMNRENAWTTYEEADIKALEGLCKEYKDFLSNGKTERECVAQSIELAKKAGYQDLEELIKNQTPLKAGNKVYRTWMEKTIALFQIGEDAIEDGLNILGAHIDSPRLDLKQNPLYEDTEMALLDTHYYGGVKKDEITAELKDGYLTISAAKGLDKDEKDKEGKYIRRERYAGNMSRSFYVGKDITEKDIHGKYENGILMLDIPKKAPEKKVEEKKFVTIEG